MRKTTEPIAANLEMLNWLIGGWRGFYNGHWGEEIWTEPHKGVMIGVSRNYDDLGIQHTDLTWIIESDGFVKSMFRRFDRFFAPLDHLIEPAEFILVDASDSHATFYTNDTDGGAWMKYERVEDHLFGSFCLGNEDGFLHTYEFNKRII